MPDDLAAFANDLRRLGTDVNGKIMREALTEIGRAVVKPMEAAARRDLGDGRFSGWPRAGQLTADFRITGPAQLDLTPQPGGAWRVAQSGRKRGRKTVKGRTRGWGATQGKRTFDDAMRGVETEFLKVAETAILDRLQEGFDGS